MAFVQLIEFRTANIDGFRQLGEQWRRATEGKRTARREVLARDRSDPTHYYEMVFFDSYESAMQNSGMPETRSAAEQNMRLADGPPAFCDLEIIEDES